MTSFIAACGSGRSTSFIPAVPAACSVTTIAFMGMISSVVCLLRGNVAGDARAPAINKTPGSLELLASCLGCALAALTGARNLMDRDHSGGRCQRIDALRPVIKQYQDCRL